MTSLMQEAAGDRAANQQSTPVAAPQLPSPPHPVLQAAGFPWGGIDEFNRRVQGVVDSYQQAHGERPPAGLALDVVRSKVQPQDYDKLFKSHFANPDDTRLVQAVNQHKLQNPQEYLATRFDGVQQPVSNVLSIVQKSHPEAGFLSNVGPPPPPPLAQFLKQYPMVTMGILPIPSFKDLETALAKINQPVPTVQPLPGMENVTQAQLQVQARQEQFRNDAPYVRTLKQAQTELNQAMGTHLPTTGIFNQTWIDSLHNWMKTTSYAQQELVYQAQQEGFKNDVQAYVKAYNQRDKVRQSGLWGWLLGNMPLPLYGHGGFWQDLASVPGYLVGGSSNPIDIGLHALTRSAGVTLDVIGGTVSQTQADLAATTAAAYQIWKHGWGHPGTYEEALAAARQQIHANPTWLRAFGFGQVPVNEGKWLKKIDEISNVIVSLVLLRKPSLTGERVAAGDSAAAAKSDYLTAASKWAYQSLQKYGQDGIGRAAARLEGGQGARAIVARLAKGVQSGEISQEQFQSYVSDLFAHGHTDINGKTVSGPLLNSLRSDKYPAPGKFGRGWNGVKGAIRQWADQHLYSYNTAVGSAAKSFAQSLRNAAYHYVPPQLGVFDEILPERVFNFVLKHKLGDDPALMANRLESILVKAQGQENVSRITQVQDMIEKLYFAKYKGSLPPAQDPFKPLLSTEAPSIFTFPQGGKKEIQTGMDTVAANTENLNEALNKLAKLHARVILSGFPFVGLGGFSLFWKHLVGDTLRSFVGGGLFGETPAVRSAKAEINLLANTDVEASRWLGAFREKTRNSEATWAMGRAGNTLRRDFSTADMFKNDQYMTAAGGYLRRTLDDPALTAFESGDPQAMVDLVLHNRTYIGMWKKARGKDPDLTAEAYAQLITDRYKHIGDALAAQGLSWKNLQAVYNEYRGAKADHQLGDWIKDHKLAFDVTSGQVEQIGTFDSITGKWVGNVIMRPNKWNRGNFAENVLARTYLDLTQAGWDKKEALQTASSVSAALTKYHMLDFANRLQVEQNLRWLSYFATKHRLYFKWVIGTFLRHPGYAAATAEFSKTLDKQGGWTIPFRMFGMRWDVPLERLVWVPGREYDETSPLALAVFNLIKSGGSLDQVVQGAVGTQGNVITRSDTAIMLGTKLMKIELGDAHPTYGYATAGLDPTTSKFVTKALNEYQITFMLEHGHYDLESNAVKKILLAQMGEEYWRANLPLPLVPDQGRTTEQQQLMDQFMKIDDPLQRSKFLSSHPQLGDLFGVYTDPKLELHNKYFFAQWAKVMDAYRSARSFLYDQAADNHKWTFEEEKQRRALNTSLNDTRNKLLIEDAKQWGINTKGGVPDGQTIPFGPWGRLVQADPVFDPAHALHTLFPHLGSITGEIIGPLQRQMQHELTQLGNKTYVAASGYTPQEVTTRRDELIQKLAVFNSYPSDALGVVRDKYQVMVNQYWGGYNTRYNNANAAPSTDRQVLDAEFRAWRDSQDHPVVVNGITFPSPVRMAWAMLDPVTRQQRLSYLASKSIGDLANYEMDLLGVKHPNWVSNAISAIDQAVQEYRTQNPGKTLNAATMLATAKSVDKQPGYQGFYAFYVNVLTAPRIRQFMLTNIYTAMPPDVASAFREISQPALDIIRQIAAATAAKNGTANAYRTQWRKIVQEQITPWLNLPSNDTLRNYLKPMGPNFIDDLITNGRVG